MKLIRVCFFGRYSVRGFFIAANVHFSLSPIPCLSLWLGHYSCPFPVLLQRGLPEQFRTWGPVQAQRGSSAAPEGCSGAVPGGIQSCSRGRASAVSGGGSAAPERVQCCSRGGSEQFRHGGSRAVPEGGQSCSRCGVQCCFRGWVQSCSRGAGAPRAPNGQHQCRSSVSIAQGVCFDTGN